MPISQTNSILEDNYIYISHLDGFSILKASYLARNNRGWNAIYISTNQRSWQNRSCIYVQQFWAKNSPNRASIAQRLNGRR